MNATSTSPATLEPPPLRLTSFSHGGGCGCKSAPGVLSQILRSSVGGLVPPELMVGIETADDAAVYKLNDQQALIATTDFFMPIVDDPFDFGRIAATNAISDVYAMGGRPIMALALVAMPIDKLSVEQIGEIVRGGESAVRRRHPVAGSTIGRSEILRLVVLGSSTRQGAAQRRPRRRRAVLGKPIGVGVLSAAQEGRARRGRLRRWSETTTPLLPGVALADRRRARCRRHRLRPGRPALELGAAPNSGDD